MRKSSLGGDTRPLNEGYVIGREGGGRETQRLGKNEKPPAQSTFELNRPMARDTYRRGRTSRNMSSTYRREKRDRHDRESKDFAIERGQSSYKHNGGQKETRSSQNRGDNIGVLRQAQAGKGKKKKKS